jgi:hypothetical protein
VDEVKMATAKTNILINSISGRIGSVVFYVRRGTQCVRTHVIPRNPDTEAQRTVRRSFAGAVRSWQSITPEERYAYNRKARYLNMSGYNLYISKYLKIVIKAPNLTSIDEQKLKVGSLPWNLELLTCNSLSSPSVSPSYMLLSGINIYTGARKHSPG